MSQLLPVILSGGSGSRLWPVSRESRPKQMLALAGDISMLAQTLDRVAGLGAASLVICAEEQRFLAAEEGRVAGHPHRLIVEPVSRNTALAAAVAAASVAQTAPDTVLVILPADHFIPDTDRFQEAIRQAADLARNGHIVTLGITPTGPETGYGYIQTGDAIAQGAFAVDRFTEKPDADTAREMLAEGGYVWNAGIFVTRADTLLRETELHAPKIATAARAAYDQARPDLDFLRLARGPLEDCPTLSIDYAVMEHTDRAAVLPVRFEWSDLGSWNALWQIGAPDGDGNAATGNVLLNDTSGSYVHSDGPLVAVSGVSDLVVVATTDAVLVIDRSQTEEVKTLLDRLKSRGAPEATEHRRILRPWGSYEQLAVGARFQVKRIIVHPGGVLSLQSHRHRAEHWVVVSGLAEVTVGDTVQSLAENQSVYVPLGARHRLANRAEEPLILIEVQSGDYLGEDDIQRYDDIYARS